MSKKTKKKSDIREFIETLCTIIVLVLFIRTFVVQPFTIPSGSMIPTLLVGDHLFVNKFIYGVRVPFTGKVLIPIKEPARGDIVVFRYPKDKSLDYIKRVIGLPGDTVEIKEKEVFVNGEYIDDPHAYFASNYILNDYTSPRDNFGPVVVPKDHIFVMGDNRDNSNDSRFWGFVDQQNLRGKAFIIHWSWDIKNPLFSLERFTSIRFERLGNLL